MEFFNTVIQVGGPAAPDDYYKDDRTDYIMAEVIKLYLNLPTSLLLSYITFRLPSTTMLGSKAPLQASKVFPVEQKQKEETEVQFCKKKCLHILNLHCIRI